VAHPVLDECVELRGNALVRVRVGVRVRVKVRA
jgi:hypothetical protein